MRLPPAPEHPSPPAGPAGSGLRGRTPAPHTQRLGCPGVPWPGDGGTDGCTRAQQGRGDEGWGPRRFKHVRGIYRGQQRPPGTRDPEEQATRECGRWFWPREQRVQRIEMELETEVGPSRKDVGKGPATLHSPPQPNHGTLAQSLLKSHCDLSPSAQLGCPQLRKPDTRAPSRDFSPQPAIHPSWGPFSGPPGHGLESGDTGMTEPSMG